MNRVAALAGTLALALTVAPGAAAEGMVAADASTDSDDATTLGILLDWHGEAWGANLSLAHGAAPATAAQAEFSGDALGAGLRWVGERWSARADWSRWSDSEDMRNDTLVFGVARQGENWRIAGAARIGSVSAQLPDLTSLGLVEKSFDRRALDLDLEHARGPWRFWFGGSQWSYSPTLRVANDPLGEELADLVDVGTLVTLIRGGNATLVDAYLGSVGADDLQQVLANRGLQGLTAVVRYELRRLRYAASLRTLALGLSDSVLRAGFEREVGEGAWGLEYERVEIPIDDLGSNVFTLRARWPVSRSTEFEAAVGWADTERFGSSTFVGATFRVFLD